MFKDSAPNVSHKKTKFIIFDQSGILEGFSNELPNSHFKNGEMSRNLSNIFVIILIKFTAQ